MKQAQWDQVKSIVDQALSLSGQERDTYISTACQNNPEISAEIKELLRSIEESEEKNFMKPMCQDRKELVSDLADELAKATARDNFIGKIIGSHRITELLGSGGMGMVYKAKRTDGEFHHEVAIKLIKRDINTEETIQRFRMEREILAILQHPNIAQIYDGGITGDGIPYLIMEFIDGKPIDQYCNEKRLTINERLDLFQKICATVQFAHTNLVVHRDLKAPNIYVTTEGIIKILDFGVAKLLDAKHTEITLLETRPGQKFWTPQYASPEQISGEPITTGTDIYALGILLHKLLTDSFPLEMEDKNLRQLEQIIKESPPSSPSHSLLNHTSQKECARLRKSTVSELTKKLRGDLDAIVLKALRKEHEYRYASVSQLSEDIQRYSSGTPLIARKGTFRYRTGKFFRRHKTGLTAAVILVLFSMVFAGFYTLKISNERDQVRMERDKLEQVVDFMTGLFEAGNPTKNPGNTNTARMFLEIGMQEAKLLDDQPKVQARIFDAVGDMYLILAEYEKAEELFSKAVNIKEEVLGPDSPNLAESLNNLAVALTRQGEYKKAADLHRKALNIQILHFGEEHPKVAETLSLFGSWIPVTNIHEAARMRERSLEIRRSVYGDKHLIVASSYMETGRIKRNLVMPDEAIHDFQKALDIRKLKLGPEHPDVAESMILLGDLYRLYANNRDSAEVYYRSALGILQDEYESYHPALLHVLGSYADLFSEIGNYNTAENLIRQSLDIRRNVFGEDHPKTIDGLLQLSNHLYNQGKYKRAEKLHRNALNQKIENLGEDHLALAGIMRDLAKILIALKRFDEAENYLHRALEIQREEFDDKTVALTIGVLADLKLQKGSLIEAEKLYQQALFIFEDNGALNHYTAKKMQKELEELQLAMLKNQ